MRAIDLPIEQLVRRILAVAAVLALAAAVGTGLALGLPFAGGILLGALLACGSFFLMQRDVSRLLAQVAAEEAAAGGSGSPFAGLLKAGFWLRSLARLAVLALLLVALAIKTNVHPIGLVAGLAAIPISVVLVGLNGKKQRISGIPD